ncbi:MAG: 5-methyltetrahydropteroyltriglutamate--homocysteine S-methyltransferase, partial [Mycobacterium sp.]
HVLDTAVALGAVPPRFAAVGPPGSLECYFAMARGASVEGVAVPPLELTKWFDTNYHQLVPEIGPDTVFALDPAKALGELEEARSLGIETTPVLLGPFTFLLRSASTAPGRSPLSLLDRLGALYCDFLAELASRDVGWVRLDEPALVEDRRPEELDALRDLSRRIGETPSRPRLVISTYFGHVGEAMTV